MKDCAKKPYESQKGIVSFMVTLIMMLVISLIIIGFSQVARRTSREALDYQLSGQAFYAAESGVNMVTKRIGEGVVIKKETCQANADYPITNLNSENVKVTCLLVNPSPPDIIDSSSQTASRVIPINSSDVLSKLSIAWKTPQGLEPIKSGCPLSAGTFPEEALSNCNFGILRVDLMKVPGSVSSFSDLYGNMITFYMQPLKSGGGSDSLATFAADPRGRIVGASCDETAGNCKVDISLVGAAAGSNYYARISSIYRDSQKVSITGNDKTATFSGAQVLIDSTGKSQDVLRRVQARYPTGISTADVPYVVRSNESLCKKFTIVNGLANGYVDGCN